MGPETSARHSRREAALGSMRWIPGGAFRMGADDAYPEEAPVHTVVVTGFWIDPYAVTNGEFAAFVAATGYRTVAEHPPDPALYPGARPELLKPGSAVFFMPAGKASENDVRSRWAYVPGADWRHPEGPQSTIEGREREPVIHVAYEDAAAYAAWAGKALPTEAEWEFAARGGLDSATFCWGYEFTPGGRYMANTWQGPFPYCDLGTDGFIGRAPWAPFRRTATASTTWRAMSGSGRLTGIPTAIRHRPNNPAACLVNRKRSVTALPDRRSASRRR